MLEHLAETTFEQGPRLLTGRQPVHVVYGGADRFDRTTPDKLAALGRDSLDRYGRSALAFAQCVGAGDAIAEELAARVRKKLERSAVEAFCVDFEDGYGPRSDDVEDVEATRTATELAAIRASSPALFGIRIKPLAGLTARRAIRTLDLFLTAFARATMGALRPGFSVTLPKVTGTAEVAALVEILTELESVLGIERGSVRVELMIESPRSLVAPDGRVAVGPIVAAARGRCIAVHLGAYDLTASVGVAAVDQSLEHPVCDYARITMLLALADTDVVVVDGATTTLPVPIHRGKTPTAAEQAENERAVHAAWTLHARNVRRALSLGISRGWDLHPSQLPARYGALFSFFLSQRDAMSRRLAAFLARATQATLSGQIFDDAATGQGLVNFFLKGLACGGLDERDLSATTLSLSELRSRSFAEIVRARAGSG